MKPAGVEEALVEQKLQPETVAERCSADRCEVDLRVPTDLSCWPGHFPDQPLVPGVLQVDWVMRSIERWLDRTMALRTVEALKFKTPLYPGEELTLRIDGSSEGDRFQFQLAAEGRIFSQGRLYLTRGPER